LVKRNDEASVAALIGSDFQNFRRRGSIKSSPVKVVKAVMEFTSDRRHGAHPIVFILQKTLNPHSDLSVHEVWLPAYFINPSISRI
jgi:hypothetical protein